MTTPKIYNLISSKESKDRPKGPKKQNRLWMFLGLFGVAAASATAGALVAVSLTSTPLLQTKLSAKDAQVFDQGEISDSVNFRLPELTRPVNILVMGIKVLTSDVAAPPAEVRNLSYQALVNSFDGLSDTMMLLRFDPTTQRLAVLSIPRDTRTDVEGAGITKINEANVYGGPALAATTVSNLLGDVQVDRYVRINVQGVEKLIDALGGVEVYVPKDMKYTDESQHLYINLKQGQQRLNGNQALQLLRFRYDANGDIGRVQRQQMVMRELMEQTLNPATITRIPQILSVIQENVDTNLSVEELVALVGFAADLERSHVQMLMLPGQFSSPGEYAASYWLPSPRRIETMAERYFGDASTAKVSEEEDLGYVRVAIQDSTGELEASRQVVRSLQKAGYNNTFVDDPWNEPLKETRIIAQDGDEASAEAIRRALGMGEVRVESTGSLQSDVTIQIGRDWLEQASTETSPNN